MNFQAHHLPGRFQLCLILRFKTCLDALSLRSDFISLIEIVSSVSVHIDQPWLDPLCIYLTECINEIILQGQHPHKIVNFLFTFTYQNNKLTIVRGVDFLKPFN